MPEDYRMREATLERQAMNVGESNVIQRMKYKHLVTGVTR